MTDSNDMLTTRLRQAASYEALPTDPAAVVRLRAEHARSRRRTRAVTLGVAAAIAGAVVFQQAATSDGLFVTRIDQSASSRPPQPTPDGGVSAAYSGGQTPTTTPQTSTPSSPAGTPDATDEDAPSSSTTATTWPVPPAAKVREPWTRQGYDFGRVVAARMEDGHAVITFDRVQLFTREQWQAKTGAEYEADFRTVNESTRTRQFIVEDDAKLFGNWLLTDFDANDPGVYDPQQLVSRINRALLKQANQAPESPPGIGVFLFHRDRVDGPVAYLDEASMYTG